MAAGSGSKVDEVKQPFSSAPLTVDPINMAKDLMANYLPPHLVQDVTTAIQLYLDGNNRSIEASETTSMTPTTSANELYRELSAFNGRPHETHYGVLLPKRTQGAQATVVATGTNSGTTRIIFSRQALHININVEPLFMEDDLVTEDDLVAERIDRSDIKHKDLAAFDKIEIQVYDFNCEPACQFRVSEIITVSKLRPSQTPLAIFFDTLADVAKLGHETQTSKEVFRMGVTTIDNIARLIVACCIAIQPTHQLCHGRRGIDIPTYLPSVSDMKHARRILSEGVSAAAAPSPAAPRDVRTSATSSSLSSSKKDWPNHVHNFKAREAMTRALWSVFEYVEM